MRLPRAEARPRRRAGPLAPQPADGNVIESRFYRVEFDPATGGIVSIRDKELDRELVDAQAPFQLNQYVYVAGGNGTPIVMNPDAPPPQLKIAALGQGHAAAASQPGPGRADGRRALRRRWPRASPAIVHVWDDIKRIDIVNSLQQEADLREGGRLLRLPLRRRRADLPLRGAGGHRQRQPGHAARGVPRLVHRAALRRGRGRDAAIAWATPDAPLVCFQDINRGKWQTELPMTNGHLYAYVMNNYWFTNYLAGQGGDYRFRFSITSRPKADNVASARFGWAVSNPLLGVVVEANPQGPLPGEPTSLRLGRRARRDRHRRQAGRRGPGLDRAALGTCGQPTTAHLAWIRTSRRPRPRPATWSRTRKGPWQSTMAWWPSGLVARDGLASTYRSLRRISLRGDARHAGAKKLAFGVAKVFWQYTPVRPAHALSAQPLRTHLMRSFLALILPALLATAALAAEPGYFRQPAIHGNTVVFVAEGDLWSVPLAGGRASRLTTHPAPKGGRRFRPTARPSLSPPATKGRTKCTSCPWRAAGRVA